VRNVYEYIALTYPLYKLALIIRNFHKYGIVHATDTYIYIY